MNIKKLLVLFIVTFSPFVLSNGRDFIIDPNPLSAFQEMYWEAEDGIPITVFYRNESPLYFSLSIYNATNQEQVVTELINTLRVSSIFKVTFGKAPPIRPWPASDVKHEKLDTKISIEIVGPIIRRKEKFFSYFVQSLCHVGFPAPQKAGPKKSVAILILFKPETPLPCGDYLVLLSVKNPGSTRFRCINFRIKDVEGPDDLARLQKLKARTFALFGDEEQAVETILKIVKIAPDSPRSWFYLGRYYETEGFLDKALKTYTKASRMFPLPQDKRIQGDDFPLVQKGAYWVDKDINFDLLAEVVKDRMSGKIH